MGVSGLRWQLLAGFGSEVQGWAPPCARTPWAAPSRSPHGGFRASEGCGQPSSGAGCSLPMKLPVCNTIFWHFVPAIRFLFRRLPCGKVLGGWEPISIVRDMEVTCFAAGEAPQSLLCAGRFSTAVSPWGFPNRRSARWSLTRGSRCASPDRGHFGREKCTLLSVGVCFLGQGGADGREQRIPQYRLGWCS